MFHPAVWMNTMNAEWESDEWVQNGVCPLCICFMQLVSASLIISWIRSSNSDSPAPAQWTHCSLGSERETQREGVCVLEGGFPQSAWTSLFLSPIPATFGFHDLPSWNTVKQDGVFVSAGRALRQYVAYFKAMPRMLSLHPETDSLSHYRGWEDAEGLQPMVIFT